MPTKSTHDSLCTAQKSFMRQLVSHLHQPLQLHHSSFTAQTQTRSGMSCCQIGSANVVFVVLQIVTNQTKVMELELDS